jgi:hypothetical protein
MGTARDFVGVAQSCQKEIRMNSARRKTLERRVELLMDRVDQILIGAAVAFLVGAVLIRIYQGLGR